MKGDMVILDPSKLDEFRFKHVLGKLQFYERVGIQAGTGSKLFRREPVHLQIARRIASVIGVDVKALIASWDGQTCDGANGASSPQNEVKQPY